jgi:hypothetical protein
MRIWLVFILLTLPPDLTFAQEVYKWEDDNGVIHYGDKPPHPTATPLQNDTVPYSHTGNLPPQAPAPLDNKHRDASATRQPQPSPRLFRAKARLDRSTGFWLSGTVRNSGKGLCDFPAVEIIVIDGKGSVDGSFELAAVPDVLARGEEAEFEGKYFTPVGDAMSWEAVPRCGGVEGLIYGPQKRGTLSLKRNRSRKLRIINPH